MRDDRPDTDRPRQPARAPVTQKRGATVWGSMGARFANPAILAAMTLSLAISGRRTSSFSGRAGPRGGVDSWRVRASVKVGAGLAGVARFADLNDQVEATRRIFAGDTRWTVVRGSDLEEGESQGLPVWSRHVGDPILQRNITRRVDFALFMVEALNNDELIHEAPAIVGCQTPSTASRAGTA